MHPEFDIGFLGGGQLARMSIQAAQRMGLTCISLDPGSDTPASQIAASIQGPLDHPEKIAELFRRAARVTLENEFIPADAIRSGCSTASRAASPEFSRPGKDVLLPGVACLATIQDKLLQRRALAAAGVPSPHALELPAVPSPQKATPDLLDGLGFPAVLKARFGGYDGKGTRYARTLEEFQDHAPLWGAGGWMAEEFVPFDRELAVMVYRTPTEAGAFPTMETVQTNHVCDLVFPSGTDASAIAIAAVEAVGGFGLFGVELFDKGGDFLVNEIAPRPHNTGHYTLDWGGTSQFEQHIRIVMGWPVDKPEGLPTCMANLLGQPGAGDHRPACAAALSEPGIHVHWYGKAESRPGRKMGHINALGDDCVARAKRARDKFYEAW